MSQDLRQGGPLTGPDSEPAPSVPNFTLFHCIGSGGYGRVWLGRDAIDQWRAVKTVYRRRFGENHRAYLRELEAIKRYAPVSSKHESLLKIFYVGPDDTTDYFYYVMELADPAEGSPTFAPGGYKPKTLQSLLATVDRLPARQCISTGLALATALDELHRRGLVHRDIKPSNIIFVEDKPKLADIGTVALLGGPQSRVGTEGYIPSEGPGQPPADVFALGKVLYVASTGFEPSKFPEPPLRGLQEDDSKDWFELNVVLVRACKSDPGDRYQSAAELRQDLLLLEAKDSLLERDRWKRRRALIQKYGAAVCVAFLAMLALVIMYRGRAAEQTRGRELRDAQISRLGTRSDGWATRHAGHLERARKVRIDAELLDEAAVGLVGLEARPAFGQAVVGGSSVAFGNRGQVLFGGVSNAPAHLYIPDLNKIDPTPQTGEGLVTFDPLDRPLQFAVARAGTFELRDVRTAKVLREFRLVGKPITGYDRHPVLAMTHDGAKVSAAVQVGEGGRYAVWDAKTGNELGMCDELVTAMVFAPDGNSLATGDGNGQITVRAVPGMAEKARLYAGRASIDALAFGPDPEVADSTSTNRYPWLLAAGDGAAEINIYQISTSNTMSRCRGSAYDVHALAFRSDGAMLASAGREDVRIWDVATGDPLLRISGTGASNVMDYVRGLGFSADDRRLAVANQKYFGPASLSLWDIEEGFGIATLYGLGSRAERVWWARDGSHLAALGQNWKLGIWEMPAGKLKHIVTVPIGASPDNAALVFNTDGQTLAFASGGEALLYDLKERRVSRRWSFPQGLSDSLRFEGNNRLLFLHSEIDEKRGRRRMWALRDLLAANGEVPILEQQDTNWMTWETALPPGADYFLIQGGVRTGTTNDSPAVIIALGTETGKELWRLTSTRRYQDFVWIYDPTGKLLAYMPNAQDAELRRLPGGEFVSEIDRFPTAISPSGALCASCVNTGGWFLYERGNFNHAARLGIDFQTANHHLEFSPDGSRLAMPTEKGWVLVADLQKVQHYLRSFGWTPK